MKYRILGKTGLRVSEICLGTMTFGTEWGYGADEAESLKQYKTFRDAGGNFIDTANRYTEGTSELYLGMFMEGHRHEVVMATKYSLRTGWGGVNDGGNQRKNMMESVEGSLKRLKTDYLDLFYLHAWDYHTPVEEVLRGMDDLVRQGKILYAGISDTPAWVVAQANTIADLRGWTRFNALQIEYSLIQRSVEFDLTPMAHAMDMAIIPWAPLAGGALSGKYYKNTNTEGRVKPESLRRSARAQAIAGVVVQIAEAMGVPPVQVALRWLMQQPGTVIPIVGAKNAEQLSQSLGAVDVVLSTKDMERLDEVSKWEERIFPHDFLKGQGVIDLLFNGMADKMKK
jgi:aryl-alcohol dehydrogenase-like predicted oxidoreductase